MSGRKKAALIVAALVLGGWSAWSVFQLVDTVLIIPAVLVIGIIIGLAISRITKL